MLATASVPQKICSPCPAPVQVSGACLASRSGSLRIDYSVKSVSLLLCHPCKASSDVLQKRGKGSDQARANIEDGLTAAGEQTSAAIDKLGAAGQDT